MVWHEVVAWAIIGIAFTCAMAWIVKRIVCPSSKCDGCNKNCILKERNNNLKK